jgi:starvation-inducible DNA-binding protein
MKQLIDEMKVGLSTVFSFYLKAHYFHWNVEGPNFAQYHDFLGELYTEVFGSVDSFAEQLRALGSYAPGSLERFKEMSKIEDETNVPGATAMIRQLMLDNEIVIDQLNKINKLADDNNKKGLTNFIEGRLDIHSKHAWMLKSFLKG